MNEEPGDAPTDGSTAAPTQRRAAPSADPPASHGTEPSTPPSLSGPIPLSIVDLAVVSQGATSASALADTTVTAQHAEQLGYIRFWVAEHHNMPTVASTSPAVLMAHLAANTSTITVGSGGVMLPNHAPLVIAEQFALLEALHPGRIDLGIGRAPGTDQNTMRALRRKPEPEKVDDFPRELVELMGLLGDQRATDGTWDHLSATPVATSAPRVMLLGSSFFSAQLAGILGLPYAYANHFDMGGSLEAVDVYRTNFTPSAALSEPYAIVSAAVICADTDDEAQRLAAPARLRKFAMRRGAFIPLVEPETALDHPQWEQVAAMESNSVVGSPATVGEGLAQLAATTGANELMISTATFGLEERLHSLELAAKAWAEAPAAEATAAESPAAAAAASLDAASAASLGAASPRPTSAG